jgi:hypothetical protein
MVAKSVETMSEIDWNLFANLNSPSAILKCYDWFEDENSDASLRKFFIIVDYYRVNEFFDDAGFSAGFLCLNLFTFIKQRKIL